MPFEMSEVVTGDQTTSAITVRDVRETDLPRLVTLEEERYGRIKGVPPLELTLLREWLDAGTPFFLVAEEHEVVCGYYYGIRVNFSPCQNDIECFTTSPHLAEHGCTDHVHDPHGSSLYGINVTSPRTEIGAMLAAEVHERLQEYQLHYMVGFARMPLFAAYRRRQCKTNVPIDVAAKTYAVHNARACPGYNDWSPLTPTAATDLPIPRRQDPVLGYHLSGHRDHTVLAACPYMAADVHSDGYGALLASRLH